MEINIHQKDKGTNTSVKEKEVSLRVPYLKTRNLGQSKGHRDHGEGWGFEEN